MKNKVVLEINSRKDLLGIFETTTPNELLLINDTQAILNNRVLNEFVDNVFITVTKEISKEFDKKIKNVYITFIDDDDEFICSIKLDMLIPKFKIYRHTLIDWKGQGKVLKYIDDDK